MSTMVFNQHYRRWRPEIEKVHLICEAKSVWNNSLFTILSGAVNRKRAFQAKSVMLAPITFEKLRIATPKIHKKYVEYEC